MNLLRLALAGGLLCSGCAGYRIGPVQPHYLKDVHSIAVPTFRSETRLPRVEVLVADTVIKQFQQDGTYQILPSDKADVILEGVIDRLRRRPARSVSRNVLATKEFNLDIVISYSLKRRETHETLTSGGVTGRTSFFVSDDIVQDERQAVPLAAQEAAVQLVSRLSEGW